MAVSEHYSRQLSERVRAAKRKKFDQHEYCGGFVPFGYRVELTDGKHLMVVDKDEAKIVRWIYDEYNKGRIGLKAMTRKLNDRGIRSRRKGTWTWTTLRAMLRNTQYVGHRYANRWDVRPNKTTGGERSIKRPEAEWQHYHDEALRIISDAQFAAVQQKHVERSRPESYRYHRGQTQIFTGLVECECGSLMYRHAYKDRNGKFRWVYLHCGNRHREGLDQTTCTNDLRIREDHLLESIIGTLKSVLDDADELMQDAFKVARAKTNSGREDSRRIKAEIAQIDAQSAKLIKAIGDEAFSELAKAALSRQLTELETRREALRHSQEGLGDEANDNSEKLMKAIKAAIIEAKAGVTNVSKPEAINAMLLDLVGPMIAHRDGKVTQKQLPASVGHEYGKDGDDGSARSMYATSRTTTAVAARRVVKASRRQSR